MRVISYFPQLKLLSLLAIAFLCLGNGMAYAQARVSTTFQLIPPANPPIFPTLNAVATSSATDAWAVGHFSNSDNTALFTLTEHWNGQTWSIVSSPNGLNGSGTTNNLVAVADLSPTNAWAVGSSNNENNGNTQPLIEHWNGSAWSIVPAATDTGLSDGFSAIAAISANDIWIAGGHFDPAIGGDDGLIEHWNGSAWSVVPSPNTITVNGVVHGVEPIGALTAASSTDVWATTASGATASVLFEHWNGSQWNLVSAPGVANTTDSISGISASSSNDIWAVGSTRGGGRHPPILPLIEHFDGTNWNIVASPAGTLGPVSVTALTPTDAWLVGDGNVNSGSSPIVEHWDGTQWSLVTVPVPAGSQINQLFSIASLPTGTILAVGRSDNGTLAELNTNG